MRIACIGTGLIGSGWATHFLRAGHEVVAYDVDAAREAALRARVRAGWATVQRLGVAPGAGLQHLSFTTSLEEALTGAEFVQESATELLELKQALLADLDARLPPELLIATSSSGFLLRDMVARCRRRPERVIVAHPFNPPYLIPLVEIVASAPRGEVAAQALALFTEVGSAPVVLQREIRGYAGNRLQSAVWREVLYLLDQGILSASDVDVVMRNGPGIRWPVTGPVETTYLGAGSDDALEAFVALLADELRSGYVAPADFEVGASQVADYVAQVRSAHGGSMGSAERRRDRLVLAVRRALREETTDGS